MLYLIQNFFYFCNLGFCQLTNISYYQNTYCPIAVCQITFCQKAICQKTFCLLTDTPSLGYLVSMSLHVSLCISISVTLCLFLYFPLSILCMAQGPYHIYYWPRGVMTLTYTVSVILLKSANSIMSIKIQKP